MESAQSYVTLLEDTRRLPRAVQLRLAADLIAGALDPKPEGGLNGLASVSDRTYWRGISGILTRIAEGMEQAS